MTLEVDRLYPFDPKLVVEFQQGLEKLRCVANRQWAQDLLELWCVMEQNEHNPGFRKREQERAASAEREQREQLTRMADVALQGDYGPEARTLANEMLIDRATFGSPRRTDPQTLEAFARELREIRRSA